MLKHAYVGANIGFDTEENELSKIGGAARPRDRVRAVRISLVGRRFSSPWL
jgi:hypothetical protein